MDLLEQLKQFEGTKEYQARKGIYRAGKFYPYKDSLGKLTIGYGHLVLKGEDFSKGISESEADKLLMKDVANAVLDLSSLGLHLPPDSNWNDFLVMMMFQLGLTKSLQFKKFLTALHSGNYAAAIAEVRNSEWYKQTPTRVETMLNFVLRGK